MDLDSNLDTLFPCCGLSLCRLKVRTGPSSRADLGDGVPPATYLSLFLMGLCYAHFVWRWEDSASPHCSEQFSSGSKFEPSVS